MPKIFIEKFKGKKIIDAVTNLPVTNLASGIYFVVIADEKHSKTLRLIKKQISLRQNYFLKFRFCFSLSCFK